MGSACFQDCLSETAPVLPPSTAQEPGKTSKNSEFLSVIMVACRALSSGRGKDRSSWSAASARRRCDATRRTMSGNEQAKPEGQTSKPVLGCGEDGLLLDPGSRPAATCQALPRVAFASAEAHNQVRIFASTKAR